MSALRDRAIQMGIHATKLDKENKHEEALDAYIKAIEEFNKAIRSNSVS